MLAEEVVDRLRRVGAGEVDRGGAAAAAGAPEAVRDELPVWAAHLGRVHVVEAGSLRTADRREIVLHVMLDYDDPAGGSRHLLSIAAERVTQRVRRGARPRRP